MSAPIRVLLRADAGARLGTGHFARAAAVAEVLRSGGSTEVVLATGADGAPLVANYFPATIDTVVLPLGESGAHSVFAMLDGRGFSPDVVYLDHYGEVADWESAAKRRGIRLLVLDDLDAATTADVIVRPHGSPPLKGAIVERGPSWLPLSRHVAALSCGPTGSTARPLINVCFGGTDPTGETAKAIEALMPLSQFDVDVVIGPGARIDPGLVRTAQRTPHIRVHRAPTQAELAEMMHRATIALGAGGVMLWERLCLGVPSLVIAAADNQRPQIDAMVGERAIRFLGDHGDVTPVAIASALEALARDPDRRAAMSAIGRRLVDGRGAHRVAGWLRALVLTWRDVGIDDGRDLFDWRTDAGNWQHNWETSPKPELAEHLAWLKSRLDDDECVFRIFMRHDQPVGVVRFDLIEGRRSAYLSIYLVPNARGQGLGLPVLLAAERALRRSHRSVTAIVSRINRDNAASVRLHRDAGFAFDQSPERADWYDARKRLD